MSNQRIAVVSASNARYFPGLLVAIYSLLRHLKPEWSVDFVALSEGWGECHWTTLRRVLDFADREYTMDIKAVDLAEFQRHRTDYGGSYLAYARLLMPDVIFHDVVLYVDSDMVVQRDVSQLVELPWPDGYLLYAVVDPKGPFFCKDGMNCERVGIPPSAPYFNSGFLWANLKQWRNRDVAGACRNFMQRFPEEVKWWDQSVLNAVLWQEWLQLDKSWNFLVDHSLHKLDIYPWSPLKDVNVHYLGPDKPWLGFNPYRHFFDVYYSQISNLVPAEVGYRHSGSADTRKRIGFYMRRSYRNYGSFFKQSLKRAFK